jgi:hypothetical protein
MNGSKADARKQERERVREELRKAISMVGNESGVCPADQFSKKVNIGELRRRGAVRPVDPTRSLTLVQDEDGVLFWEDGAIQPMSAAGMKRGLPRSVRRGSVVEHLVVEPLEPSQLGKKLAWVDKKLTPDQGLRLWDKKNKVLLPSDMTLKPAYEGRILLIVHGTFSESDAIFEQLTNASNKPGIDLLGRASKRYEQILAFDHPTLSVSPMLNALEVARRFEGSRAEIDVISHSRGGLVARWWLETFDRGQGKRRVVFLGAPLDGTSLAAPPRLRHVLSWFSNLNRVLARGAGIASSLIPFLTVVACLAQFTAIVSSLATEPMLDAAVAMIPGLASMSRTSNNCELNQLNAGKKTSMDYFVIASHYRPEDPGWKFWEYFVDPLKRAAMFIFPGENDLVVDTEAMSRFCADVVPKDTYDFGATSKVFHTNYFSQPETCERIGTWLGI